MIYLISNLDEDGYSFISSVYESERDDLKEIYLNFMYNQASNQFLNINKIYLNPMSFQNQKHNLSFEEYKLVCRKWMKFLEEWTFEYYINHYSFAKKIDFKQVLQK